MVDKFDVIALGAFWDNYVESRRSYDGQMSSFWEQALKETVDMLAQKNKTIILLGDVVRASGNAIGCPLFLTAGAPQHRCEALFDFPKKWLSNEAISRIAKEKRVFYWDANEALCPQGKCHPYRELNGTRVWMYWDADHISWPASKFLGHLIVKESGVPKTIQAAVNK